MCALPDYAIKKSEKNLSPVAVFGGLAERLLKFEPKNCLFSTRQFFYRTEEKLFASCEKMASEGCRGYLFHILYQYHFSTQERTFSNGLTKVMLQPLSHDLQGCLASLSAFQDAWNDDQSIVKDFIKTHPSFKARSDIC